MDLSLGTTKTEQEQDQENIGSTSTGDKILAVRKEHMFEKVVTPSDVGKLNRLVIPKQHAEKYFPLGASSHHNGMLLNFEDRNGKAWRFRYSYWTSSQSYVMTKGWSRFVKDKKLDAGDIVSFQRGVGELERSRLFIDWRLRVHKVPNPQFGNFDRNCNFNLLRSVHHGGIYNNCSSESLPVSRRCGHLNIGVHSYNHQTQMQHQEQKIVGYEYGGMGGRCYLRPFKQNSNGSVPVVIDSVPVFPMRKPPPMVEAAGKRLRLFGVNMECANDDSCAKNEPCNSDICMPRGEIGASSSDSPLRLGLSSDDDQFAKKGKTSLSFDLDLYNH